MAVKVVAYRIRDKWRWDCPYCGAEDSANNFFLVLHVQCRNCRSEFRVDSE